MSKIDDFSSDSDLELQEAFAKGEIKSGEFYQEINPPKTFINDKVFLYFYISKYSKNYLEWAKKQDQLNFKEYIDNDTSNGAKEDINERIKKEEVLAQNDFQRELYFYNLAQTSCFKQLQRLRESGTYTERPDDYFAEMIKSDMHMDRIKRVLIGKQNRLDKIEKIVKSRREKNFKKKVAKVNEIQKRASKKSTMEKTKLWKQRKQTNTPGEEESKSHSNKFDNKRPANKMSKKAIFKNQKFGQTGNNSLLTGGNKRKRGSKANNMKADDIKTFNNNKSNNFKNTKNFGNFKSSKKGGGKKGSKGFKKTRPGKNRRLKMKSVIKNRK
ncbi:unnamed protein product [Gordionus sp. m RMFG-2023]